MKKIWNKCDMCGKFISMSNFLDGKAKHTLVWPDSDQTSETWETLCAEHNIQHPELDQLIKEGKALVDKMTPEEFEKMKQKQAQSWARQDKD